jgi:hypothetical protein
LPGATTKGNGVIEFLDPRADPGTPVQPYSLSIDLTAGAADIGLLANGFPGSAAFLDHVAAAMAETLPGATFSRYDKGDPSSVASDQMLDTIVAECRAVVAAYGH